MKLFKKISIFASFTLILSLVFSICAFATEVGKDTKPASFNERLEFAVQGTVTGLLMVFAVLTLLTLILYLSKVIFHDIPKKKKEKAQKKLQEQTAVPSDAPAVSDAPQSENADDGELAAVITAAIAAMLDSEEYKDEFKGGFRVVSFKRNDNTGAWNKK